jgi:hypothetical protein
MDVEDKFFDFLKLSKLNSVLIAFDMELFNPSLAFAICAV